MPIDNGCPPTSSPLYDYATDVEPAQNPGQDKGLQEKIPANVIGGCDTGCLPNISSSTSLPDLWAPTPQLKAPQVALARRSRAASATSSWTAPASSTSGRRPSTAAVYPGKICVWLFVRTTAAGR